MSAWPHLPALPVLVLLLSVPAGAQGPVWRPPSGGAVEMFRQADRAFTVGACSGGAGGQGESRALPAAAGVRPPPTVLSFELSPVTLWDEGQSPAGRGLDEGRVHFYRAGAYEPEITGAAKEGIPLPPGTWYLLAEAPGWVTTYAPVLDVGRGSLGVGDQTIPVTPACRVRLAGDGWEGIERVDLVSVTEAAVYPLLPAQRREAWLPAGRHLAYTVAGGRIAGIGEVHSCEQGDRLSLAPPAPPTAGRQALIVGVTGGGEVGLRRVAVTVRAGEGDGRGGAVRPAAALQQGGEGFYFFPDLAAGGLDLRVEGPGGEVSTASLPAGEGTVRQMDWEGSRDGNPAVPVRHCGSPRAGDGR